VTVRTVFWEGQSLSYQLERKAVKNLNLRVRPDGSVYVSAPGSVPLGQVDDFVVRNAGFIQQALQRLEQRKENQSPPIQYATGETFFLLGKPLSLQVMQGQREGVCVQGQTLCLQTKEPDNFVRKQRLMSRYRDEQCRLVFEKWMQGVYPAFQPYGIPEPTLRMRDMKSRWGSCMPQKGIITLNKRLLEVPEACIEYVVVHEFCHFLQPNHSPAYYAVLERYLPDWKARKRRLNHRELW
jgi:predicted metal-dependent hydrolase